MRILLIDNYDSFTYNVYQYLLELNHEVKVIRNDKITLEEIKKQAPDAIFLSPGPKTPREAGICIPVIKEFAGKISIFGICLGHQAIGEAFGGIITYASKLMHGKTSRIISFGRGIMKELPNSFIATRYHSLVIKKDTLPDCLEITCESEDGEIMGVRHKEYNIEGVQFHPESIMTEYGKEMLKAFLDRTEKIILEGNNESIVKKDTLKINTLEKDDDVKEKLPIYQYVEELDYDFDAFSVFKKLQERFGRKNCFLLESVSGPKIDCTRTTIGLFPQFEILLDNSNMKINASNEEWEKFLNNLYKDKYVNSNGQYNIGADKFSKIFKMLSACMETNKRHNKNLTIDNGLAGYFSYEYLHYIENIAKKLENPLGLAEVHLKYFPVLLQIEHEKNEFMIIENRLKDVAIKETDEIFKVLEQYKKDNEAAEDKYESKELPSYLIKSNITKETYLKNVEKAKKYIYEGDIFQVQLGQRICIEKEADATELYGALKRINPSPYMFYWDNGDYQLIGDSPELQLRIDNGKIMIRPIAGTSKGKGTDEKSRNEILTNFKKDAKENAEHIMLVDLARNDIGTMASKGSVQVSQLMNVEEFSHVFHLTSTVVGELSPGLNSMEVFEYTFPAGTLTGAPKIRAMEIISELESEIRGPYGGAFGFFDFGGNIVSSIIIRTILKKQNKLYIQASAGIVADSVPESEWEETFYKMRGVRQAISEV